METSPPEDALQRKMVCDINKTPIQPLITEDIFINETEHTAARLERYPYPDVYPCGCGEDELVYFADNYFSDDLFVVKMARLQNLQKMSEMEEKINKAKKKKKKRGRKKSAGNTMNEEEKELSDDGFLSEDSHNDAKEYDNEMSVGQVEEVVEQNETKKIVNVRRKKLSVNGDINRYLHRNRENKRILERDTDVQRVMRIFNVRSDVTKEQPVSTMKVKRLGDSLVVTPMKTETGASICAIRKRSNTNKNDEINTKRDNEVKNDLGIKKVSHTKFSTTNNLNGRKILSMQLPKSQLQSYSPSCRIRKNEDAGLNPMMKPKSNNNQCIGVDRGIVLPRLMKKNP